MKAKFEYKVPTFWELSTELKKKLISEFSRYVWKNVKFQHFVMIFSITALAIQTQRLLETYLLFETVVKVDITKPFDINIPGVTICMDKEHMVLKSKLEVRYPQLKEELQELSRNNVTDSEEILKVYRKYKDLAYNTSNVDEWFSLLVEPQMVVECKIIARTMWAKKLNLTHPPTCEEFAKPYWNLPTGAGICWSYFSQINPADYHSTDERENWYRMDVEKGVMASFRLRYDVFDLIANDPIPEPDKDEEAYAHQIWAIITHPKLLNPMITLDRATIKMGTNFDFYVSQTNAELLGAPYITDCRKYEKEGRWKRFKSNYQCLDDCVSEILHKKCKCVFHRSHGDRITKWWPNNTDRHWDKEFCHEVNNSANPCEWQPTFVQKVPTTPRCALKGICNNDCFEEYYRAEVKQTFFDKDIDGLNETVHDDEWYYFGDTEPLYTKAKKHENFSTLNVKRKDVADITYIHTREMIFVEFVCYFGGLLGLWLGVSMLDVYDQMLVWWAEAPIEYQKWLDRQRILGEANEPKMSLNRNGNVSLIGDNLKAYVENGDKNGDNTMSNIYDTQYGHQYTKYQYN